MVPVFTSASVFVGSGDGEASGSDAPSARAGSSPSSASGVPSRISINGRVPGRGRDDGPTRARITFRIDFNSFAVSGCGGVGGWPFRITFFIMGPTTCRPVTEGSRLAVTTAPAWLATSICVGVALT